VVVAEMPVLLQKKQTPQQPHCHYNPCCSIATAACCRIRDRMPIIADAHDILMQTGSMHLEQQTNKPGNTGVTAAAAAQTALATIPDASVNASIRIAPKE